MSAEYEDRVQETTTTTGTGAVTVLGAVTGFRTFASAYANGDRVTYTIAGGAEWESGEGIYSGGAITRLNVFRSSNSNSLVSFSSGTKAVWSSISGQMMVDFGLLYAFHNCLVNQ